jgi:hypothetical protein
MILVGYHVHVCMYAVRRGPGVGGGVFRPNEWGVGERVCVGRLASHTDIENTRERKKSNVSNPNQNRHH